MYANIFKVFPAATYQNSQKVKLQNSSLFAPAKGNIKLFWKFFQWEPPWRDPRYEEIFSKNINFSLEGNHAQLLLRSLFICTKFSFLSHYKIFQHQYFYKANHILRNLGMTFVSIFNFTTLMFYKYVHYSCSIFTKVVQKIDFPKKTSIWHTAHIESQISPPHPCFSANGPS